MNRLPLWGLIFIALYSLTLAKRNYRDIEKVEVELDLFGGDAKITYNNEWKSKVGVLYAQKKKMVAYKDKENDWCLLEKLENKSLFNEEHCSRQFSIVKRALDKDQLEKMAGKNILKFCAKHQSILLKAYSHGNRRLNLKKEERAKREVYTQRGNESEISHQEISKKLLEDLSNAESVSASRINSEKGLKRNVNGRTEFSGGHYPSASAKVAHPAGIDHHTRIRNNIFPGSHVVHPIDITSSVTITTGSKIWSYPPSSGGYHNASATSYPLGTSNLPQSSQQNTSHDAFAHGVQHTPSYHHHYHPSYDQTHRQYVPSTNSKFPQTTVNYMPSSSGKTQTQVHYQPSSAGRTQPASTHYPPSATSKSHQPSDYYPPSSTSKTQSPSHYPPSSSSKSHQSSDYYPPSSTSKTQSPSHYPPSSSSKSHQSSEYYPPSSTSKTQSPSHYPPSSSSKSQQPSEHYPPSSTSKTQSPSQYPPSATTKYQPNSRYYPPSSTSKTQSPSYYPPSATSKSQQSPGYYPPSSTSKTQPPSHYPPSATTKYQPNSGYYPPSSSSKSQGTAEYPPSSSSKPQSKVYSPSAATQAHHGHGHYPPSSVSKPQHYPPSSTDKSHNIHGHYPPSSVSKTVQSHYPPSGTTTTHRLQQNGTTGSPSAEGRQNLPTAAKFPTLAHYSPSVGQTVNHFATSHTEQPTYVAPSWTSKIHHQPQNGTHFQYNSLYSYGGAPGVYAPQFPPSSTSKIHSPQQFPSQKTKVNQGVYYRENPHSLPQYPVSSSTKFHTKLDHSGSQTPHFAPSSTSKMLFTTHDSSAPVLERPSAEGNPHEHGSYPPSSSSKVHPDASDVSQYPPSSTSKTFDAPSSDHNYGGSHQGHTHHLPMNNIHFTPASGSPPSAQIPQPPVSEHFPPSSHAHNYATQYYPPSSTSKLHHVPKQNATAHSPPTHFPPSSTSKFQPSSVGLRLDFSGLLAPAHIPYFPPSTYTKSTSDQGLHPHSQQYPYYPPSSSSHHSHNGSLIVPGKSLHPSSGGHDIYSEPEYPPSSGSKIHPNGSDTSYSYPAMPLHPSPHQHYPTRLNVSHHTPYHQQNIPPESNHKPQFQQGSSRPCHVPLYSITTRTIVTPNGVIQRPVSVKNTGESPCGNVKQGVVPYNVPCGSSIRNGQPIRGQSPCMSSYPNQRKSMRSVLVPGPALMPDKSSAEQNEFANSDGVVITNVGESEAEVLDGIGYPVPHQQFSHLKELKNATSKEMEDEEGDENQTKLTIVDKDEQVEDAEQVKSTKREEEEVKEGDVLEPGDRILGENGYTISEGFRGRVVSVTGQVGKTRGAKTEKKSNSAQFRYFSELGRYAKDDEGKRYSDCQGEVTFTCSEFLGSNGRAKICKPNPRRNPDGSPC